MLAAKLRRAMSGQSEDPDEDDPVESFRSQFLNIWPVRRWASQFYTWPDGEAPRWAHEGTDGNRASDD